MIKSFKHGLDKRKRAVCVGDMGHAKIWYDPETKQLWQHTHRWGVFPANVPTKTIEEAVNMLSTVPTCELYLTEREIKNLSNTVTDN